MKYLCRVLKGAGSQSVVSVSTYSGRLESARLFYRVAAELCEAAQLCVYLSQVYSTLVWVYLGILIHVFGVRYAVYILITYSYFSSLPNKFLRSNVKV